ncbi:RusA family crossover junction endodeoxyribonuclease [Streptomyces roseifaciens]
MTASTTVVRVIAVSDGPHAGILVEDAAQVWVRVLAWSPRRAFLTSAAPFAKAAGVPARELAGHTFLTDAGLGPAPGNDHPAGEEDLEWPGLLHITPRTPGQAPAPFAEGLLPVLSVTVYGLPGPQGSKRHVGNGRMLESSRYVKPWREAVVWATRQELIRRRGWQPLTGPLAASMVFSFVRPKSHFGTGRNAHVLKASAPCQPDVTPDLSKLARSTEDALTTAGAYRDDALLVSYRRLEKRYTTDHGLVTDVLDAPGAVVHLYRAQPVSGGESP